jgi:hypothetical protein
MRRVRRRRFGAQGFLFGKPLPFGRAVTLR